MLANAAAETKRDKGVYASMKRAFSPYVENHSHAVLYGIIGFVAAALILIVGFWPTVLLAVFAAIGVVIGGAFGKITTSLVNDVIMPLVGMLIGGIDLGQLDIVLKPAVMNGDEVVTAAVTLGIGTFLTTIIDFILVALVIFIMIKAINRFHKKKEEAPAPEEPKGPTSEELLTEIRDLLKEKNQ